MKLWKQWLMTGIMAITMMIFIIPTTAMAEENVYKVSDKDTWDQAVSAIEALPEDSDATVILTNDVGIFNNQYKYSIGVEGRHITVKSEGDGAPYSIGAKSMSSVSLNGDMTFENVWFSLGQGAERSRGTVSSFYANGHTVEFTENFAQIITDLYGGAKGNTVESTHLIINGDIICDENSQNFRVFGGGENTSSITTNGKVSGDVLIELGPHCRVPWVYGGGFNSSVGGDVTIELNGDVDDPNHIVGNITGGGLGSNTDSHGNKATIASNGKDSGTVIGDINLNLYSGRFAAISGGGGQNGTSTRSYDIKNTTYPYYGKYLYYATVGGDVNVVIGKDGADEETIVQSAPDSESVVGSINSVIQGDVNITINDGAFFPDNLTAMGSNDVVEGCVNITMNGGQIVGTLHGFGEMWFDGSPYPTQTIGKYTDNNEEGCNDKTALDITINDGEIGAIAWSGIPLNPYSSGASYKQQTIYGNVMINIHGGTIGQVYMGDPTKADPNGWKSWQKIPKVYGTKGIELHITGGSFTGNPSIYAHPMTVCYNGQRIYLENDEPVYLYQIVGANSSKNGNQADIIVNNTALASIMYYESKSGTPYFALEDCGDIEIISGKLGLAGENTISGNFTIHKDGTLALTTTNDDVTENAVLNVEGEVKLSDDSDSAGWLQTVEPTKYSWSSGAYRIYASSTEQLPEVGQVYLRSKNTTTETAQPESDSNLLDLANSPNQGRYVEYTTDSTATTTSYAYAWRIAQGEVTEVTWYYEIYYQNPDGTFTKWKDAQGGKAEEATTVSITHDQFDGTDLGWGEKLGTHYVFDEKNPNNRLSATASEATKDNPLKIYYKCAPHTVTYEYDNTAPVGVKPPQQETHYYSKEVTPTTPAEVSGYTFNGWTVKSPSGVTIENGVLKMPNEDVVLVGSWKKTEAAKHSVTFLPGEHGTLEGTTAFQVIAGQTMQSSSYTVPTVREDNDYDFAGWLGNDGKIYTSSDILNLVIDQDRTFTAQYEKDTDGGAHHPEVDPDDDDDEPEDEPEEIIDEDVPLAETPWLNTEDHYAYIIGYAEDGTVRPQANITRAEVATIFFRLLTDDARDQFWSTSNNFSDVTPDAWYNNAVSTMVNAGIIQGYEDGTFRPNNNITRAEFAAIASRFMSSGYDVKEDLFSDIADHWARESINDAAMAKWINGYPDGTFLPNKAITRAEAVTLVNNVLQRKPDADHMLDTMIKWPDNPESAWYYEAIQEATNSHDYDLFEGAEYETWTALLKNRDWAALEKDWTNAHRIGGEGA